MTITTPLVAFSDVAVCDAKHGHEVNLITDGLTAYAYGPATDCPLVSRAETTITVQCGQPGRGDEPCPGEALFQLDAEGCWNADPEALSLLSAYGQRIEQ